MLRAMAHVTRSHLLDRNLYPFESLQATGVADAAGDKAFDDDPCTDAAPRESVVPPPGRSLQHED
jgi:tRNA 2-thiocytidine biosynthesis protein TtcA